MSAKHATEQLHMPNLRRLARGGERAQGGIDGSTATLGPNLNKPTDSDSQLERAHGLEQPFRVGRASHVSTGTEYQTLARPGQLDSLRAVIRGSEQHIKDGPPAAADNQARAADHSVPN